MMTTNTARSKTETGYQLVKRLGKLRYTLENAHSTMSHDGMSHPTMEITGAHCLGQSLLLCDYILNIILPSHLSENFKECKVILVNTNFQLSLVGIVKFAEKKLLQLDIPADLHDNIVKMSLKRLTIFNCFCSQQLELTLHSLENFLLENLDVALIAIDSLSAHYWSERHLNQYFALNRYCHNLLGTVQHVGDKSVSIVVTKYSTAKLLADVDYSITVTSNESDIDRNKYLLECYDHQNGMYTSKFDYNSMMKLGN